ncbi:sorting nexin-11 isoform X1 [Leptonychotes weddellii]|uniref:Sorting nexin-11 isoform X1 n=1 Tax=Leptonychotes weddellii TaxID=9713 RepID=A0A7F8RA76_LEPWE|nr:sorting nexin-11 isoform X1 [Leptonychotes weddellii]
MGVYGAWWSLNRQEGVLSGSLAEACCVATRQLLSPAVLLQKGLTTQLACSGCLRCFLPMGFWCRMLENQEQEEVITVRVQDPRVQNEGSWNSYVDYKIFLHTNSKAFTAKTSCVRRRYREFVWLRKQLQRNAGLVPVPELPGKSTFFGSSDEFIEKRRQGLQHFLEKVLQSVVLLSDSQLHLFLQSQLSVPEIEACVQGQSTMTVSDAILHYAMSNCGWVQEERQGSSHLAKGDQSKSCCFLPRSGRRSSPSPPPREEKDHFEPSAWCEEPEAQDVVHGGPWKRPETRWKPEERQHPRGGRGFVLEKAV